QDIGFRVPLDPVERAERAELLADVRVVDIAVDDVADDAVAMAGLPDGVGRGAEVEQIRLLEESGGLLGGDAAAGGGAIEYLSGDAHRKSMPRTARMAPTSAAIS